VTLSVAVREGRLAGLVALRDSLAMEIEAGPRGERAVSQTAALARQLRDTLREIEVLEKAKPRGSIVDDLASRRTARGAKPKGVGAASGAKVERGA
jgi:hypothetical protein